MDNRTGRELTEYLALMERHPEYFRQSELLPIETDVEKIRAFTQRTGRKIGVVYRSEYNLLVTDLIRGEGEHCYVYERVIPAEQGGVVVIARYGDRFVLLKQYRHALRAFQYAFVRGFGERSVSPAENAAKEVSEELGTGVTDCVYLGSVCADSGLTAGEASVFLCTIRQPVETHREGIEEVLLLTQRELEQMMAEGKISDGFTLAAYALFQTRTGC